MGASYLRSGPMIDHKLLQLHTSSTTFVADCISMDWLASFSFTILCFYGPAGI